MFGNSLFCLDATSGTTADYAKAMNLALPLAATPELRGSFVEPPESIPISLRENWNGLRTMVEVIQARKLRNAQ
jgi:hypothetical protein